MLRTQVCSDAPDLPELRFLYKSQMRHTNSRSSISREGGKGAKQGLYQRFCTDVGTYELNATDSYAMITGTRGPVHRHVRSECADVTCT